MLTHFSTGMERVNTLLKFREKCEFPPGFEDKYPDACKVALDALFSLSS
jgi:hypothetical protein